MPRQNASQPYAPGTGYTQTFPPVFFTRDPTSSDSNWIQGQQWVNVSTNAIWQLTSFSTSGGVLSATWTQSASLVSGILPVTQGGTGVATLTGLALGAGTSAFTGVTYVPAAAWVPNLQINGSSVGITYGTQVGFYYQIGSVVFVTAFITLTSKGASVGGVTISNLPVATGTNGDNNYVTMYVSDSNFGAGYTTVVGNPGNSNTVLNLQRTGNNVAIAALQETEIADTTTFIISGFYLTN